MRLSLNIPALRGKLVKYFEEFGRVYDERNQGEYGYWQPAIRKAADESLDCGDLRHGFARIRCENPDFRHEWSLAFSCRSQLGLPNEANELRDSGPEARSQRTHSHAMGQGIWTQRISDRALTPRSTKKSGPANSGNRPPLAPSPRS